MSILQVSIALEFQVHQTTSHILAFRSLDLQFLQQNLLEVTLISHSYVLKK
ncbi:hypothetical protein X975_26085, partial [Stegodyphus mimosarum]